MKSNQSTNYEAAPDNLSTVQAQQAEDKLSSAKSPAFQFGISIIIGVLTILVLATTYYYGVFR